jgi:hypothetical protein
MHDSSPKPSMHTNQSYYGVGAGEGYLAGLANCQKQSLSLFHCFLIPILPFYVCITGTSLECAGR